MKQLFRQCLVMLGLLVFTTIAFAQQAKTIKGTVTDDGGLPLPGVNVMIKGTTQGTITDVNGNYALDVTNPETTVVEISFVGFKNQSITVGTQSTINVKLSEDSIGLDEVVAVGYGVVKKKDLTGSVASIKSDDITKTASSNAIQSMQARVPGVDIQQKSGEAGAGLNINLRGNRSISASNSPLILVDGVEYGSTLDINPSDIESMDVLKDASSTAIYGTRGANGVVLITTKRGKSGKTQVTFNSYVSSNIPTNIPKVMYGTKEVQRLVDKANYAADLTKYTADNKGNTGAEINTAWGTSQLTPELVLTESLADFTELGIYQDGSYTDWADLILQNGMTQNYEIAVSGGNEKTTFNLSLGMMDEQGLLKNDEMNRYNGKMSLDHKLNDVFKVGGSMLYTYKDHDARQSSVFTQSMKMTTITHPYTAAGVMVETPNPRYAAHCNPLLDEVDGAYQKNIETSRFFGNTYLDITPMKNLVFKTMFALDRKNVRTGVYQDYKSVARYQSPGTSYISSEYENTTGYTWENTLNYTTDFNQSGHSLTALIGQSAKQTVYEENITGGDCGKEHYYVSSFYDLSKITKETSTSKYNKTALLSYFGRLNYSINSKYLFTASVRADGSSTLSEGNQWGYFPSLAAAWRINDENFMAGTQSWLSNMKLRASWGISGNAAVNAYSTMTTLSPSAVYYYLGGTTISGNIPSVLGNPDLTWETTAAYNLGLDFGVFNNRVSGSVDYYMSKTSDLLYRRSVPGSSVYTTVIANIGATEGNGLEVSLNTLLVKTKDFSWDVNWSYATSHDEITTLQDGITSNISGVTGQIVGEPVSIYFDYEDDGCWGVGEFAAYKAAWAERHAGETIGYVAGYGAVGSIKIVDRNDDGKLNDDDKKVYDRSPKHVMGMNNSFTYKNLSLSVLVYARLGGYISYDMNEQLNYESANWGDLDYWSLTNLDAKFPSPGADKTAFTNYGTSLKYEKADYLKIKDITLSYNLPKTFINKAGIERVKIYGSLKNFITISGIDNYDPERGGSIAFPLAKQVVAGVSLEF